MGGEPQCIYYNQYPFNKICKVVFRTQLRISYACVHKQGIEFRFKSTKKQNTCGSDYLHNILS